MNILTTLYNYIHTYVHLTNVTTDIVLFAYYLRLHMDLYPQYVYDLHDEYVYVVNICIVKIF